MQDQRNNSLCRLKGQNIPNKKTNSHRFRSHFDETIENLPSTDIDWEARCPTSTLILCFVSIFFVHIQFEIMHSQYFMFYFVCVGCEPVIRCLFFSIHFELSFHAVLVFFSLRISISLFNLLFYSHSLYNFRLNGSRMGKQEKKI